MASELELQLLGNIRILDKEGRSISLSSNRDAALLFYLAVERDTPQRRELLYTILWPGMPESSARHNLRQALYQLRLHLQNPGKTKEAPIPLIANRSIVQLNPEFPIRVDVHDFLVALASLRTHQHTNLIECPECRSSLERAVGRYRGDFLEGFYLDDSAEYEAWAQARRTAYREQMLAALDNLSEIHLAARDYKAVQHYAEWQLNLDPLRESAYRQLMRAQALEGDRIGAMRTYQRCERLLQEELGIAPSLATQEFYQTLRDTDAPGTASGLKEMFIRGYQIVEQIGSGASGTVYRAAQAQVGREAAIKVIPPETANQPDFIRRFESEAQSVASLEHPYIVPLYDYWREPDGAYLVMRFFHQGNLSHKLAEGPLELAEAGHILEQVAAALSAAHRKGIVHGNLKPANILLDTEGNAYLSDFGIAQAAQPDVLSRKYGGHTGSQAYLAPEQIKGEPVNQQTDLFSLAIILFEMLVGQHPFPNTAKGSLKVKLVADPIPSISDYRPDLSEELDAVIQQATKKDPAERFADLKEFLTVFRRVAGAEATAQVPVIQETDLPNPYKGLRAFQEADAADFFGREELTRQLLARLQEPAEPNHFLAVVGPSGSGKSSVVRAGLVPALRSGPLAWSKDWFIVEMTPGTHPLEELELVLTRIAPNPSLNLMELLRRDTRGLLQAVRMMLPKDESRLLLVIDQFEELFTLVDDPAEREFFLSSLHTAVTDARSPIHAVITLRADFYDRPLNHDKIGRLMEQHTQVVLPMTNDEIALAIRKPAERVGVDFEMGLVTAMVADIIQQPGALPLLQYALFELFERRNGRLLTAQTYTEIGGLSGALGRRAEEVYGSLGEREQQATRQMFLRLVTLGDGVEDTRRRVRQRELEAIRPVEGRIDDVLEKFGQARLLTFDRDPVTRGPTAEVAHEALLRNWPRLSGWLEQSRGDILQQRQLARAAQDWEEASRDPSFLLRGARLETFRTWRDKTDLAVTSLENEFLQASIAGWEREQEAEKERLAREQTLEARSRTILRVLVGVFAVATVLALFLSNFAFRQQGIAQGNAAAALAEADARSTAQAVAEAAQADAEEQANVAAANEAEALIQKAIAEDQAREIAAQAARIQSEFLASQSLLALQGANRDLALALAMAAIDVEEVPSIAEFALSEAAYSPGLVNRFSVPENQFIAGINPYGTMLLTGYSGFTSGALELWSVQTGEVIEPPGLNYDDYNRVISASFSPNDKQVLIGMRSLPLTLVDVETGEILQHWPVFQTGPIVVSAFSPDGRLALVSAGLYSEPTIVPGYFFRGPNSLVRVSLLDLQTGQIVRQLEGHTDGVFSLAFDPTGKTAVTGSLDGSMIWWDIETGKILQQIFGNDLQEFNAVAFSADGKAVLASQGSDVAYWNLETGQLLRHLGSHDSKVSSVAISHSGRLAASGDDDGEIILWELDTGHIVTRLQRTDRINRLNFSLEDENLIIQSRASLEVWSLGYGPAIHSFLHSAGISEIAIASDGSTAISLENESLHLWDLETGLEIVQIHLPGAGLAVAYAPYGNSAFVSTSNGRIIEYDLATGNELRQLEGKNEVEGYSNEQAVNVLAISPDGSQLLSGALGNLRAMILWDLQTGNPLIHFLASYLSSIDISPDGRTALTSVYIFLSIQGLNNGVPIVNGNEAILWDLQTGHSIRSFEGHDGSILDLAYSPDGRTALTASLDSTLILWDIETGSVIKRLLGHLNPVTAVAFSPDGRTAISGSQDQTLILWDLETGAAIRRYYGHNGAITSVAFSPDGQIAFSADTEGAMIEWRIDSTLDDLVAWTLANRSIPELTCSEREQFNIEPLCR